jgi:hypothetical protein
MAIESATTLAWAKQVLTGDTTFIGLVPGGVHLGLAPVGSLAPVCTLWTPSGTDYNSFNFTPIWVDAQLLLKVSAPEGQFANCIPAARQAYLLLQKQSGGAQGGTVLGCARIQDFTMAEPQLINGVQWLTRVQVFRTFNA